MNTIYTISLVLECMLAIAIFVLLILGIKRKSMFCKKILMIVIALLAIIQIPQIYLEYILERTYYFSVALLVMWTIDFFVHLRMFLDSKGEEEQRKATETSFVEE